MAVRIPYIPLVSIHHKPSNRVLMNAKTAGSQKGSSLPIQIKSNIKLHKVFEDESSGVVCYKDDKGEIICEGYDDEGPRLHQQSCYSHPRDGEGVVGLLKRSLFLVTEGAAGDKEERCHNNF